MPRLKRTAFAMALAATALAGLPGCRPASIARATTPSDGGALEGASELPARRALARELYVAGVPLLARYAVVHARNIDRGGAEYQGPLSVLHWVMVSAESSRAQPGATQAHGPAEAFTVAASLDLRAEPMVVRVPALPAERTYLLQLTDLQASVPAQISSRSTGNQPGDYLVVGPGWQGEVPVGIVDVIHADTTLVSISGWVQGLDTDSPRDQQTLQRGFKMQPLSRYLAIAPPPATRVDWPQPLPADIARHSALFFAQLEALLSFVPPQSGEADLRQRLRQLEITPPQRTLAQAATRALREGMADGQREIDQRRAAFSGCDAGEVDAAHSDAISRACAAQRTLKEG